MFILCFKLLAITADGFLSQNPFLVATVRFSSEKLRLDDVEESSFSKEFREHIFMDRLILRLKIELLFYPSF